MIHGMPNADFEHPFVNVMSLDTGLRLIERGIFPEITERMGYSKSVYRAGNMTLRTTLTPEGKFFALLFEKHPEGNTTYTRHETLEAALVAFLGALS
jgi:hypothetical protein